MLADRICALINEDGPLRLDRYIGICLYDPREGYYATRTVFGNEGDFITSPEISQIFGETIGVWVVDLWARLGAPQGFTLLELGAGRGTLMRDLLSATKHAAGFLDAVQIAILENSARRREEQLVTINRSIAHLDHLRDLAKQPTIVIANEFFDALPIRQFRNEGGGWLEAYIDADLEKIWQPISAPPAALARHKDVDGIVEWNEASSNFTAQIAAHIQNYGGGFLAIDYGDWDGYGDTLQAIENHEYTDPFTNSGLADITAHVRFADLAGAFTKTPTFATQAEFLTAFGGENRRDQLIANNPDLAHDITTRYDRLIRSDQMGELFKVLAIEGK